MIRALGEAVPHLPWLSPCAASLLAMAKAPTAMAWAQVRGDPGAVLLLLRHTPAAPCFSALLRDPAVLDAAVHFLQGRFSSGDSAPQTAGFVEWNQQILYPIYRFGLTCARLAGRIAEATGRCDSDCAWAAGLLAPLGWYAVAAVDAERAAACFTDPDLPGSPLETQQRHWGLDQAGIARRLLRRWQVPNWLAAIVANLGLPAEAAEPLGAEPDLFRVVQLAVGLTQEQGGGLALSVGESPGVLAAALGLPAQDLESLQRGVATSALGTEEPPVWQSPASMPLLLDLLRLAADNRRLSHASTLEPLEMQFDCLHQALAEQHVTSAQQLQTRKLQALAEFAAGAGHEINNPLAVISGQAQYLLRTVATGQWPLAGDEEADDSPGTSHWPTATLTKSLQTIIGQTQRIHHMLNELMQFARPPRPQKEWVEAGDLVRDVTARLSDMAIQRRVQVAAPEPKEPVRVYVDPRQIRTALTCLLRNAIEAAPPGGWAGIRLESPALERLQFLVEDNGPGPTAAQRPHLFDPFYSGRQAGRGRGLGLPTSWRLAREHGGDVFFDERSGGPTRFVLWLPCPSEETHVLSIAAKVGEDVCSA